MKETVKEQNEDQNKLWKIKRKNQMNLKSSNIEMIKEEDEDVGVENWTQFNWDVTDEVKITQEKLVVLVIGEEKSKTQNLVEFMGIMQNRLVIDLNTLMNWNAENGFEVGLRIQEALADFEGE